MLSNVRNAGAHDGYCSGLDIFSAFFMMSFEQVIVLPASAPKSKALAIAARLSTKEAPDSSALSEAPPIAALGDAPSSALSGDAPASALSGAPSSALPFLLEEAFFFLAMFYTSKEFRDHNVFWAKGRRVGAGGRRVGAPVKLRLLLFCVASVFVLSINHIRGDA